MARFILIGVLAATLISLPAQAQMLFFFVGSSGGGGASPTQVPLPLGIP